MFQLASVLLWREKGLTYTISPQNTLCNAQYRAYKEQLKQKFLLLLNFYFQKQVGFIVSFCTIHVFNTYISRDTHELKNTFNTIDMGLNTLELHTKVQV